MLERSPPASVAPIIFLFTGEGAHSAESAAAVDALKSTAAYALVDAALQRLGPRSLDQLFTESLGRHTAPLSPLVTTAINILNYERWRAVGREATFVVGHSIGEVAAAYAAELLTLDQALAVAHALGVAGLQLSGAMLQTRLTDDMLRSWRPEEQDGLCVAAINSAPAEADGARSVTLCGPSAQIESLLVLDSRAKRLLVPHPWHHHAYLQEPGVSDAIPDMRAPTPPSPTAPVFVSSTQARIVDGRSSVLDAAYWREWLSSTVRFADALTLVATLLRQTPPAARTSTFAAMGATLAPPPPPAGGNGISTGSRSAAPPALMRGATLDNLLDSQRCSSDDDDEEEEAVTELAGGLIARRCVTIETGPHPVLTALAAQLLEAGDIEVLGTAASMRRGEPSGGAYFITQRTSLDSAISAPSANDVAKRPSIVLDHVRTESPWWLEDSTDATPRLLERLSRLINEQFGLSPPGADAPLMESGLDSSDVPALVDALNAQFDARLPATLVLEAGTLRAIAARLMSDAIAEQLLRIGDAEGPDSTVGESSIGEGRRRRSSIGGRRRSSGYGAQMRMEHLVTSWEQVRVQKSLLEGSLRRIMNHGLSRAWVTWTEHCIGYKRTRLMMTSASTRWISILKTSSMQLSFAHWAAVVRRMTREPSSSSHGAAAAGLSVFAGGNSAVNGSSPPSARLGKSPFLRAQFGRTGALALLATHGRWPGGTSTGTSAAMLQGACGDALGSVPAARWTAEAYDTSSLSDIQMEAMQHGGFVAGAQRFDHVAFAISPAEAAAMDPQQRLLLELGYASLHGAAHRRATLRESECSTFLGMERPDWAFAQPPAARSSVYVVTGDNGSVAAGRIAFVLGLHGQCATVDTACASSLSALHIAALAVKLESNTEGAMAAGSASDALSLAVGLKLEPLFTLAASAAGMLSADGRCKSLDTRANGYVRAEGIGTLVLRPRSEQSFNAAVVHSAVLAGSAAKQDGRSASLTAPNGAAQRSLLLAALVHARLTVMEVSHMELHGTGTALGDPTEAGALAGLHDDPGRRLSTAAMPKDSVRGQISGHRLAPLVVGAVKASVGHAEAAAGMAGLQKVASLLLLSTSHGNAMLNVLNPLVHDSLGASASRRGWSMYMLATQMSTTRALGALGVSSFGYSGTITHAVLRRTEAHGAGAVLSSSPKLAYRRRSFLWREGMARSHADASRGISVDPAQEQWLYAIDWPCVGTAHSLYTPDQHAAERKVLVIDGSSGQGAHQPPVEQRGTLHSEEWDAVLLTSALSRGADDVGVLCSTMDVVQSQAQHSSGTAPRLWILTHETQKAALRDSAGKAVDPSHAGIWGLARACRAELPALPAWCVDLTRGDAAYAAISPILRNGDAIRPSAGSVRGLNETPSVEPEAVCSRDGMIHVPRLFAPHSTAPRASGVSCKALREGFFTLCSAMDRFRHDAMAKLDMPRLARAYDLLYTLCHQYAARAVAAVPEPVKWHHKLLHAWAAKYPGSRQAASELVTAPSGSGKKEKRTSFFDQVGSLLNAAGSQVAEVGNALTNLIDAKNGVVTAADVTAAHPALWAEVQLAEKCGPFLGDVFRGTQAYQELLFPEGSMDAVIPVYEDAIVANFCNNAVLAAIKQVLAMMSASDSLVMLEIGAGVGGTASSLLPVLKQACERYVFTDVSEVFLINARKRFASYKFLSYALLPQHPYPRVQSKPCLPS